MKSGTSIFLNITGAITFVLFLFFIILSYLSFISFPEYTTNLIICSLLSLLITCVSFGLSELIHSVKKLKTDE